MIRPDVELIRSIADTVATQEGRRGGSESAHTLALETKTLAAYVEYLEAELKRAREHADDVDGRRCGLLRQREEIVAIMEQARRDGDEAGYRLSAITTRYIFNKIRQFMTGDAGAGND